MVLLSVAGLIPLREKEAPEQPKGYLWRIFVADSPRLLNFGAELGQTRQHAAEALANRHLASSTCLDQRTGSLAANVQPILPVMQIFP